MLEIGTKAPDAQGTLDDGSTFKLSEALANGPVVLYFYPKDFTMGCTKEACSFRDNFGAISEAGATLVGVSGDDEDSHARFREKHNLPFRLLADPDKRVTQAYEARGLFGLMVARITYVIGQDGLVHAAFRHDMRVTRHVPLVLEALAKLPAKV